MTNITFEELLGDPDMQRLFKIRRLLKELYETASQNEGTKHDVIFQAEQVQEWLPEWIGLLQSEVDHITDEGGNGYFLPKMEDTSHD